MRALILALAGLLALTGCGRLAGSPLNPSNWFGSIGSGGVVMAGEGGTTERPPLVTPGARALVVDARPLLAEVTEVQLEPTPDGAILRATGLAQSQGWFNAGLVLTAIEGGTAVYAFRAEAPRGFAATGTPASRRIAVAEDLARDELQGISRFRVEAAGNSRTVSR